MIPKYHEIMLPLLERLSSRQVRSVLELQAELERYFGLTQEEKQELIPSGKQGLFRNRVGWATTYLKMAKLIEAPRKSHFRITARGLGLLAKAPTCIDDAILRQYPEYVAFRAKRNVKTERIKRSHNEQVDDALTPEESLEASFEDIHSKLALDLLAKVLELSPKFFEHLVVELLVRMGYGGSVKDAGRAIGGKDDKGIDGVIKEDKLGLDSIYIQAKRWTNPVGRMEIQSFAGALLEQGAKKGVFITTSRFTKEAQQASFPDRKIILIDGETLAKYMIEYNVGCTTQRVYEIKRIDEDFFAED